MTKLFTKYIIAVVIAGSTYFLQHKSMLLIAYAAEIKTQDLPVNVTEKPKTHYILYSGFEKNKYGDTVLKPLINGIATNIEGRIGECGQYVYFGKDAEKKFWEDVDNDASRTFFKHLPGTDISFCLIDKDNLLVNKKIKLEDPCNNKQTRYYSPSVKIRDFPFRPYGSDAYATTSFGWSTEAYMHFDYPTTKHDRDIHVNTEKTDSILPPDQAYAILEEGRSFKGSIYALKKVIYGRIYEGRDVSVFYNDISSEKIESKVSKQIKYSEWLPNEPNFSFLVFKTKWDEVIIVANMDIKPNMNAMKSGEDVCPYCIKNPDIPRIEISNPGNFIGLEAKMPTRQFCERYREFAMPHE